MNRTVTGSEPDPSQQVMLEYRDQQHDMSIHLVIPRYGYLPPPSIDLRVIATHDMWRFIYQEAPEREVNP